MESPLERFDRNAWQREWRRKHPARAKEIDKASRLRRRDTINAYHRARYRAKRDEILSDRRAYFAALKDRAYEAYGGYRCNCCGECTKAFLCIDHIRNDGHSHRKTIGRGNLIYRWLAVNDYPGGFQILCFNCNQGRRLNGGVCPHAKPHSYDDTQAGAVLTECQGCGKELYMTHPKTHCKSCRG